jgi:carboxylesterase type B
MKTIVVGAGYHCGRTPSMRSRSWVGAQCPGDAKAAELVVEFSGYWTRFAATGNPNSTDLGAVHWPAFTYLSSLMVFGSPTNNDNRAPGNAHDFWEPYFLGTIMGGVAAAHPTVS